MLINQGKSIIALGKVASQQGKRQAVITAGLPCECRTCSLERYGRSVMRRKFPELFPEGGQK
jgi:hypothetical protein